MTGVPWFEQERQGLTGCLDDMMYSASGRATPGLLSQLARTRREILPSSVNKPWAGSNSYKISELMSFIAERPLPVDSPSLPFCVRFNVTLRRRRQHYGFTLFIDTLQHSIRSLRLTATPAGVTPACHQTISSPHVHVCRKRLEEPESISWARLRRQIMKDVRQLQEIIEQHQKEGLGEADLQVIRRGKALEYYSRHYGKVYIEKGREEEFTVRDALVGINQLLDDESDTTSETPPVLAEPYTRQFLRLFADKSTLERDQMQKHLRGTGVSPSEFLERGWCSEEKKVFTVADPLEWANDWKGKSRKGMSRDFDQTYFLIGACYDDSGIKLSDTLNSGSFVPHPAISDLLDWFGKHGSDSNMKAASKRAKQIYSSWLAKNTTQVVTQRTLFDLEDE